MAPPFCATPSRMPPPCVPGWCASNKSTRSKRPSPSRARVWVVLQRCACGTARAGDGSNAVGFRRSKRIPPNSTSLPCDRPTALVCLSCGSALAVYMVMWCWGRLAGHPRRDGSKRHAAAWAHAEAWAHAQPCEGAWRDAARGFPPARSLHGGAREETGAWAPYFFLPPVPFLFFSSAGLASAAGLAEGAGFSGAAAASFLLSFLPLAMVIGLKGQGCGV